MSTDLIDTICRLCAKQGCVSVAVFGEDGLKQNIGRKVRLCTPIIIKEEEDMPKQVCLGCINQLDRSYELYLGSVNAQTIIKKLLGKRQTRSSAAMGSNRANKENENCGVSKSFLNKLNSGEVSLDDFLADEEEPSPPKIARTTLETVPANDDQLVDVKPVPGVDIPDVDTLLQSTLTNGCQQPTENRSVPKCPMVTITPSAVASSAGVPIPPPETICTSSAPGSSTTMSYVMDGMGGSSLLTELTNSTLLVQGSEANMYLSNFGEQICAVAPATREQNVDEESDDSDDRMDMGDDSENHMTYTTLLPASGLVPSTSQPNMYISDVGYASESMYMLKEQPSTVTTWTTEPGKNLPQQSISDPINNQCNRTDPPKVVYSNRASMPGNTQYIPAVSLTNQSFQTPQVSEQNVTNNLNSTQYLHTVSLAPQSFQNQQVNEQNNLNSSVPQYLPAVALLPQQNQQVNNLNVAPTQYLSTVSLAPQPSKNQQIVEPVNGSLNVAHGQYLTSPYSQHGQPMTAGLNVSSAQYIPGVSLVSQSQQHLQVNEQTGISHSNNVPVIQENSVRLSTSSSSDSNAAPRERKQKLQPHAQKSEKVSKSSSQKKKSVSKSSLQQHVQNPVKQREQLQQQLPLLRLPSGQPSDQSQQEPQRSSLQQQSMQKPQRSQQQSEQRPQNSSPQKQPEQRQPVPQRSSSQQQPGQKAQRSSSQQQPEQRPQKPSPQQQLKGKKKAATPSGSSTQSKPIASVAGRPKTSVQQVRKSTPASTSAPRRPPAEEPDQMCEICEKPFPPDILIHHRVLHYRERFFTCIACGKNFVTEVGLDTHRCESED